MSKRHVVTGLAIGLASVACVPRAHAAGQSCEELAQLNLSNTTITSAETVAAGAFTPPANMTPSLANFYKQLPTFCRVTAVATPSADSHVKIEVWLPTRGWNGKFRGQGNGGFAGEIDYHSLGQAVSQGYAAAATDTGHAASGTDARWALGHPEKITDFAYRAIHEMTAVGKATVKAFYGDAPRHAYFASCSNGGRQALMEAQRFPEDYDGILAGAPANYWTHLLASALWDAHATTLDPASYIPTSKIPAIAHAVNEAWCLTQPQVTALEKLYQGARDSKGRQVFPGFMPGGEEGGGGWPLWITGHGPGQGLLFAFGNGYFSDMVYNDANWNYKTAKLDDAVAASDEKFASVLNSTAPYTRAFASHGGKLIIYHGWNDAAISALNSIDYYETVRKTMGPAQTDSFLRLYMVPGMQHCGGGPGTDTFGQFGFSPQNDPQHNMYVALEQWVEKGSAPTLVIASRLDGQGPAAKVIETRPVCAYPQEAKYKGSGDTSDAANFVCAAPEK
ncbi:MAG: tannase/feruloyl esterase family alpha/beta hydrolase [Acidobacteria bacterium]|nr:MAG: tannase/feruloyl esterase family alpha/beta hydrolase [Acidobacteriota bacterium]